MLRPLSSGLTLAALSGLALLTSSLATTPLAAQTLITPLGLTPGEWDFRLDNCVFLFVDCTGRFRVYASPSDAPSMSPSITLPSLQNTLGGGSSSSSPSNPFGGGSSSPPPPPPATTVAGWDAFRLDVPASPTVPDVRTGPPPLSVETVASSFGTNGMQRSVYDDGVDGGFLDWPDIDYFRSDNYSQFRVAFPPGSPISPQFGGLRFEYSGEKVPIIELPIVRWSSTLFTGYAFEYRTGITYLKPSTAAAFSPAIADFTGFQALGALRSDILAFLGLPVVEVGDPGVVAWDPFNLVSRETLLRVVRDIDSGAARYDGGFSMAVRDDLDTFLPPTRSVPEPSALALLAFGVVMIVARRRR